MNPQCEGCAILADPQTEMTVFATKYWRVVLAADQGYLGRAYVSLLPHVGSLSMLSRDQWNELHAVIARYEALVTEVFGATLFNWSCLMNDAFKEEIPTPHVHWHVRPRYDVTPIVGEIEYPDPNFAHHYDRETVRTQSPEKLSEIVSRLRAGLASA